MKGGKNKMKNIRNTIGKTSKLLAIVGTLTLVGCTNKIEETRTQNSNQLTFDATYSRSVATDMDYDGKIDIVDSQTINRPRTVYYKNGYGPAQRVENTKFELVDEKFFEAYDHAYQNKMREFYYHGKQY